MSYILHIVMRSKDLFTSHYYKLSATTLVDCSLRNIPYLQHHKIFDYLLLLKSQKTTYICENALCKNKVVKIKIKNFTTNLVKSVRM